MSRLPEDGIEITNLIQMNFVFRQNIHQSIEIAESFDWQMGGAISGTPEVMAQ